MRNKKALTAFVIITLFLSIFTITSVGNNTRSDYGSIPEHEEFTQPSRKDRRTVSGGFVSLKLFYDYEMTYDVPPEDIIINLEGSYDVVEPYQLEIMFKRPDGHDITLLTDQYSTDGDIDQNYRLFSSSEFIKEFYEFGTQFESTSQSVVDIEANKVAFSKADENIFSDPEMLKEEYTIQVSIIAKDLEMDYGGNKTVLKVMSLPPGPVSDLTAEAEGGKVTLNWEPPIDKGGSDIIQYNIYRGSTYRDIIYLDNVSADKTSFTDDNVLNRNLYFYKVAAINKDTKRVENGWIRGDVKNPFWRSNCDYVIAYPSTEKKESGYTGAYRWMMDYSYLTKKYLQKRMDASATVNDIQGKGMCLYKIESNGTENGLKRFDYEGGFYSNGSADISLQYEDDTTFNIDASVNKTDIDFSGKLWVNESKKGLNENKTVYSVKKQVMECHGEVDFEYEYQFLSDDGQQVTDVSLDMVWNQTLTMEFKKGAAWLCMDSNEVVYVSISPTVFSGSVDGTIDAEISNQGDYSNETTDVDEEYSEEISEERDKWGMLTSMGHHRIFSPVLGNVKFGYYRIIEEVLDVENGNLGSPDVTYPEMYWVCFSTNNQMVNDPEGGLYSKQYLDPMTFPGLQSILEAGFVRIHFLKSEYMDSHIQEYIRQEIEDNPALQQMNSSELESWRENETERLHHQFYEEALTEPCWEIQDQQMGVDNSEYYYSGIPMIDVVGFEESESVDSEEVDIFLKDKQAYEVIEEDEKKTVDWMLLILIGILGTVVYLAVIVYMRKQREEGDKTKEELEKY